MSKLTDATKDELILAMLAVLGGEEREVNERDFFLASWHAFPSAMRWVDTALPNPETFMASLRRLDQRGQITRTGKQRRVQGKRRPSRRSLADPGRSGVVKTRIAQGATVDRQLVEEVRRLLPEGELTTSLSDAALITLCVALRLDDGRHVDEGTLVELAFHKFADRFAYKLRPEFPDLQAVRSAISAAQTEGLLDSRLALTSTGRDLAMEWQPRLEVSLDVSQSHAAGDLMLAERIENLPGYQAFATQGTLVATRADELYRALRVPPTVDPAPVASALVSRVRALRRVDRSATAAYLIEVARKHNPNVLALARASNPELFDHAILQPGDERHG
jgi:hypothetical protein